MSKASAEAAQTAGVWFEYFSWTHVSGIVVPALTWGPHFSTLASLHWCLGFFSARCLGFKWHLSKQRRWKLQIISRSSRQSYTVTPTISYWLKQVTGPGRGRIDSTSWCESRKATLLGWQTVCGHLWKHNLPHFASFISVWTAASVGLNKYLLNKTNELKKWKSVAFIDKPEYEFQFFPCL